MKTLTMTLFCIFSVFMGFSQREMTGVCTFNGSMTLGNVYSFGGAPAITKGVNNLYLTSSEVLYAYDDSVRLIRNDGTIILRKKLPHYVGGTPGTSGYFHAYANTLSFNHNPFIAGRSYQSNGFDTKASAIWKWDTLTNTLVHVRGFAGTTIWAIYDTPSKIYALVAVYPVTHLGTGLLGDGGASLVNNNPAGVGYQLALLVLDHNGNLLEEPAHFYDSQKNIWARRLFVTSNGNIALHLVRATDGQNIDDTFEEYAVLLDGSDIANTSNEPNIITQSNYFTGGIGIAEDSTTQNFYLSYYPRFSNPIGEQRTEKYVGEDWSTATCAIPFSSGTNTYSSAISPYLMANDGLVSISSTVNGSLASLTAGGDTLDLRYNKYNELSGGGRGHILSFTELESEGYLSYVQYSVTSPIIDSLFDYPVPPVASGQSETGLAFFVQSNTPIQERIHTNSSDPDVIETFDYVMRSDTNNMLMDTSENHIAYMQFLHDSTYLNIGLGNLVPSSWFDVPNGWFKGQYPTLEYDTTMLEYYFYASAAFLPYYDSSIVLKVICTTDDIYDYTIYNNPPIFDDVITTQYYADLGQPTQFDFSATDIDGDVLSYWTSGLIPIGMVIDNTTGLISGVPTVEGNYVDRMVLCTDGIDTTTRLVSFYVLDDTGVDEHLGAYINIYPNPSNAGVTLDSSIGIEEIVIIDHKGRELIHTQSMNIDVSFLDSGYYFILIHTEHGKVVKRLIKE